jgi:hypothetical protein
MVGILLTAKHFDALAYVKRARELGTSEELAEFQARQIEQAIEVAISTIETRELATKNDIIDLRKELVATELRLVKWILGTGITGVLAIAGLLKFIH